MQDTNKMELTSFEQRTSISWTFQMDPIGKKTDRKVRWLSKCTILASLWMAIRRHFNESQPEVGIFESENRHISPMISQFVSILFRFLISSLFFSKVPTEHMEWSLHECIDVCILTRTRTRMNGYIFFCVLFLVHITVITRKIEYVQVQMQSYQLQLRPRSTHTLTFIYWNEIP